MPFGYLPNSIDEWICWDAIDITVKLHVTASDSVDKLAKWEHEVQTPMKLEQRIRKLVNLFDSHETHSQFSEKEIKYI